MRTMKLKLLIACIFVCCFVGITASPAAAATVLYQSANTDIYLGEPYASLEFENPLAGTEMIKEYAVKEWMDADYDAGPPRWYDDWSVSDPLNIDGYFNEIWMRMLGHSIWTSTTVPSTTVSIHLHGDDNDGVADVLVDGILAASIEMGTSPGTENALIIVKDLANITHHIRVNDLGVGPNNHGRDIATMGAAALEKKIKWSQPPIPTVPENLYYGWNEVSDYNGPQIVADDWECNNDDPVTDIHWWGSYVGWSEYVEPPVIPESFHITFWNDIPDPTPDDPNTFSHPNEVVWEIDCYNFDWSFAGWDYDPITNCFETCYFFEQYLTEAEYFFQHSNPDGTPSIYWISIAANYPAGAIVENPWGWKTRPNWFNDDAVIIRKPTTPHIGDKYVEGKPIYWPDPTQSWDMAFELTSIHIEPNIKWDQPPDTTLPGLHCHDYVNIQGNKEFITIADDWTCRGGEVTDLHWYGNYETDALGKELRGSGVRYFHLSIHYPLATVACIPQQNEIVGYDVLLGPGGITEIDTGLVNSENCRIYLYEYDLPTPFVQEIDQDYWLDITAFSHDENDPALWRWQEAARTTRPSPWGYLCGAVSRISAPPPSIPGPWQTIMWPGDLESDMAFAITSTPLQQPYTKWSQPPEPYRPEAYDGWNEYSVYNSTRQIVADDWRCDTDDPVTDIHWWGSFIGWPCEEPPEMPESFHITIWTDVPAGADPNPDVWFSHPGIVIWETDCTDFTYKFVGWDIDPRYPDEHPEACFKFEQDLPEDEWFEQKPGGNIYWISIAAQYTTGTTTDNPWGWKTRRRDENSRAPDDAVRIFNPTDPILGSGYGLGEPIWWPTITESWDMAFELTTKEPPPKKPVPHLKWSQPPIEVDPNSEIPEYSGWDEISYIDQDDATRDPFVADDYRCLGSMPVTSIHWWGSHYGFVEPGTTPPLLPAGWKIGFWSNVPEGPVADYSYPEKMLWEVKVPADRVEVEEVGTDFYHHHYPNDVAYQYTLHLEPNEVFWQGDYLDDTQDDVFWLSIAAIYSPDIADIQHPWGWKTRPWSWMDDAVRFTYDGSLEPGTVLDPIDITPIKDPRYFKSVDVAFELDTDPNYIKWEQPFIGIRKWPHYEDEKSMARVVTTTENVIKWIQRPDLTDNGVDVDATHAPQFDPPPYDPQLLADDFNCVTTETIDDIHIYGSWMSDNLPGYDVIGPGAVNFTLSIHEDLPVGDPRNPHNWSIPGDMLWSEDFAAGNFTVDLLPTTVEESYYIPCSGDFFPNNHYRVYKYNFFPTDPFPQKGSTDNPIIYWLDVQARPLTQNREARFGWKTRDIDDGHFNDDAAWVADIEPYNGTDWRKLIYPSEHPLGGQSMDLAFELTSNVVTTEFIIDRLVADDWKCDHNTPVTDAVWWGSYIGYQYKPCHGELMQEPNKPDYFLLNIWSDVPADTTAAVPFSHPNEILWEYKAYDYDEVLVGYDKHPHDTPGAAFAREPVFRYSVRLPKENWFQQRDANDIYWFSVVAVYEAGTDPLYDWGWTNHKYVFNDDAVAGSYDSAVGEWSWNELHDQLGNSEDMSFMLFTEPGCFPCAHPDYSEWLSVGKPDCWCHPRQCHGDADSLPIGKSNYWTSVPDLEVLKAAWNMNLATIFGKKVIDFNPGCISSCNVPLICADFDHKPVGKANYRVSVPDLIILKANWNIPNKPDPNCFDGY